MKELTITGYYGMLHLLTRSQLTDLSLNSHMSDSIQGSDYITIFVSLNSGLGKPKPQQSVRQQRSFAYDNNDKCAQKLVMKVNIKSTLESILLLVRYKILSFLTANLSVCNCVNVFLQACGATDTPVLDFL